MSPKSLLIGACITGAAFLTSCTTGHRPLPTTADGQPLRSVARTQDPAVVPMSQIHPRTMAQVAFQFGEQDLEVNTGAGVASGSSDGYGVRLRGEHFLESELGLHVSASYYQADDLDNSVPRSGFEAMNFFLGVAYRATVDDDFRLVTRFGPFFHESEQEVTGGDGDIQRQTVGVRLAAEPEYIIFQHAENGKICELSAYAEFGVGAGPSDVKDDVDSEDGYAFNFNWEGGVRYRLPNGLMASIAYFQQKNHYGATESYNNPAIVFNGVDDDFNGFLVSAGIRF